MMPSDEDIDEKRADGQESDLHDAEHSPAGADTDSGAESDREDDSGAGSGAAAGSDAGAGSGSGSGGDDDGDTPADPAGGGDDEGDLPDLDEVDVRDLLRRALDEPVGRHSSSDVLSGVQRRLRKETEGRFFADGWSTSTAPRERYVVTSILMLVLIALAWLLLGPYGIHRM